MALPFMYYILPLRDVTYFAEVKRQEGNWLLVSVLGKKKEPINKWIVFDGKIHIVPIPLWINRKTLKSETNFGGARHKWIEVGIKPEVFEDKD